MMPHLLQTIFKRVFFRKGQMALEVIIVVIFTIALSFIPHSIVVNTEQVNRLYRDTEVMGTIVRDPMAGEGVRHGEIGLSTQLIEDIIRLTNDDDKPRVSSYFAVTNYFMSILPADLPDDELEAIIENFRYESLRMSEVVAFNQKSGYEDFFGRDITVEYLEGFSEDFFVQTNDDVSPIIISSEFMEREDMKLGDYVNLYPVSYMFCFEEMVAFPEIRIRRYQTYKIVGVFEGQFVRTHGYISLDAMQRHESLRQVSDFLVYWPFEFIFNTELNREIEVSRDEIIDRISRHALPFILITYDDTLRDAVMPLERNIAMMNNLYPIILGLSMFTALGLVLLTLLLSTKDVAVIRVMGMSKRRIMVMLFIEKTAKILLGFFIGGLVSQYLFGYVNFIGIALYLLGGVMALGVFAVIFVWLQPLKLLQVRE
jgi:hypothetical protein